LDSISREERDMNTHRKNEGVADLSGEQATEETKVSYRVPEVTVMGRVEQLTALKRHGPPDPLGNHQLV
jgi:hypothetical protein